MEEKQPYECTEITELNPTFLYTWKGTRDKLTFEEPFHCHEDHIEMAFVLSGEGRYRFEDGVFPIREGDLLIINPGVRHQALARCGCSCHGVFRGLFRTQTGWIAGKYASRAGRRTCHPHGRGAQTEAF